MPQVQDVTTRRNAWNQDFSKGGRHAVVRSFQSNNDRAHFRMNIAKNVGNARPVEKYIASRARFVKTEVEAFSFEKRENVVKEGISVGKFHDGSHGHDQKMRLKAFVVLCQAQS